MKGKKPMENMIPRELKPLKQWVLWQREGERKTPKNWSTGGNAGIQWPNTWGTYKQIVTAYRLHPMNYSGIGLVLTQNDPYVCIDLDDCFQYNRLTAFAKEVVDRLQGYTEFSPSGKGLHIWIKAEYKENHKRANIEIYSKDRWLTMTGKGYEDLDLAQIPERTEELLVLLEALKLDEKPEPKKARKAPRFDLRGLDGDTSYIEDKNIWERLFRAKNGNVYEALYNGDISVCYNDHSRAVLFLANQLAVMTNFDANRIKHLLYQTRMANEKWDRKTGNQTWLDGRIQDAIAYMAKRE